MGNIRVAHRDSNAMFQARQDDRPAMAHVEAEIAHNRAVFPDAATLKRLEMMRDLDRHNRRVLNRIWTEIKLR